MNHSSDYHDYVFKDGKLIGKFEEMYQYSLEIPWHQDKTAYSVFSDIDIAILRQFKYDSICEIGCGLGHFSNRLYKELRSNINKLSAMSDELSAMGPKVTGIDVSQTAINKAKNLFPEISFIAADLANENPFNLSPTSDELSAFSFNLVVVKEVLWYVCNDLKLFIQNVLSMIKKDGFLYISQSFPDSDKWVGKEMIDSPERLREILVEYVEPISICFEREFCNFQGQYVHYLGQKP